MSTYVISDLHGAKDKFDKLLKLIHFNENDTMYIIGDVIDRGKEPIPLLLEIMSYENIHLIIGNHEHMMYKALVDNDTQNYRMWLYNGGLVTEEQLFDLDQWNIDNIFDYLYTAPVVIPDLKITNIDGKEKHYYLAHSSFINSKHIITTKTMKDLKSYEINEAIWSRDYPYHYIRKTEAYKYFRDSILITGHTPTYHYYENEPVQTKGHIFFGHKGHFIGIDCGCALYANGFTYGRLGCLRLEDNKEFYV